MKSFRNFFILLTLVLGSIMLTGLSSCSSTEADANQKTSIPKSPERTIQEAAFMGDANLLQAHIAASSDLNQKDDFGSTPLIIATTFGKTAVAKLLIEAGADIDMVGADGGTPLHGAAFYCRTEIVEALLAKGADLTVRNTYGATALESVEAPFELVKIAYHQISKDLGPLGFKLDYEYIKATRPKVAEMIRRAEKQTSK